MKCDLTKLPSLTEVTKVLKKIEDLGFQAVIAGGAVRDIVMGVEPHDIDIATNAPMSCLENIFCCHDIGKSKDFGLVVIKSGDFMFEIAQFRSDGKYSDGRRPDSVQLVSTFREDASRRDFTINAMGIDSSGELIDFFDGLKDIESKIIRTVGSPLDRFEEDKLRMLRALRFAAKLQFYVDADVLIAISEMSEKIQCVSIERIRDEMVKACDSGRLYVMLTWMFHLGLFQYIVPELVELHDIDQTDTVRNIHLEGSAFRHTILCMKAAKPTVLAQFSALLHDLGKVQTRIVTDDGRVQFLGHDDVSAQMAETVMKRLKFDNDMTNKVVMLVRNHMRFHNTGASSSIKVIRRAVRDLGEELIWDLLDLAEADCLSTQPVDNYVPQLRERVAEIMSSPMPVRRKAILSGVEIMGLLNIGPGPMIGQIQKKLIDLEDEYAERGNIFTKEMAESAVRTDFNHLS